ncbi:D-(-)-3-hydroxybutyrate oligomer hydrolase [Burkholderia multivorans]|nr:D-(-)-3-hydroxybutyrate oligomer hydrolase [Burkholderia multivorans]
MRSDRTERAWDASLRGVARVGHLGDFDLLHASMCGSQAIGAIPVTYANASTRSRVADNLGNFGFASVYESRSRRPARPRRRCARLTCRPSRQADRHRAARRPATSPVQADCRLRRRSR